jgi:uncharacterized protein (DUF362 family)
MSEVYMTKANGYRGIYSTLSSALTGAGFRLNGSAVAIKINLCDARSPDTGAITHPLFLDAILWYLRERHGGLQIYVVESDATVVLADEFIKWFGFIPILEKWDAQWVNLSKEKTILTRVKGRYLKEVPVPEVLTRSFLITQPKLKTNILTTITGCLKNQFGCLPMVEKSVYHEHIDDVIVDANLAMTPNFCIVDGILGMSQGPAFGTPIKANMILFGNDPVAIDALSARIMGFNPRSIGHVRKAAQSGLGSIQYTLRGDKLEGVDFEVSKIMPFLLNLGTWLKTKAHRRLRRDRDDRS